MMTSRNYRIALWLHGVFRGIKEHKKKITLFVFIGAFLLLRSVRGKTLSHAGETMALSQEEKPTALTQTEVPTAIENENLEDELNKTDSWPELNYPAANKPPTNVENAVMAVLNCVMAENKGIMDKRCIRRFKELVPGPLDRKTELVQCAVHSFRQCTKRPKDHEFSECMLAFNSCILKIERGL